MLEEALGVLVVPEVVVAGSVLVVIGEWDGGHDDVHAVLRHVADLFHAVVIDRRKALSLHFHSLNSNAPAHALGLRRTAEPVFLDDLPHPLLHGVVLLPLFQQHPVDGVLRLRVDDVDDHRLRLQEAVYPVDGLNEIIELVVDADEDGPVAVPLEVAAGAGEAFLRGEEPTAAL